MKKKLQVGSDYVQRVMGIIGVMRYVYLKYVKNYSYFKCLYRVMLIFNYSYKYLFENKQFFLFFNSNKLIFQFNTLIFN